tara:strand:- start:1397 stop:2287 length:891 start_codon:yes stop_codon:yes gene_type:complete
MNIGAFEIFEPIPEFQNLQVISMLHPWVDAGNVGTLTLNRLEDYFDAKEFARLKTPGRFFDFTRYRPETHIVEGSRETIVPNTNVYYTKGTDGSPDLLFLHLMEPHAFAETYIKSLADLLKAFDVKRYCRISGMYNAVPHTRPLKVTGSPGVEEISSLKGLVTPRQSVGGYTGPTSIMNSLNEELEKEGIETISFMVHLPHYLNFEEDHSGTARLTEILCALYGLPKHLIDKERGDEQYMEIGADLEYNERVQALVIQLEEYYDNNQPSDGSQEDSDLSPDVEKFLREITQKLDGQ